MAKKTPQADRWSLGNWTQGSVTLFQALGITKGQLQLPTLKTRLTSAAAAASQSQDAAKEGSAGSAQAAISSGGPTGTGQAPGTNTAAGRGSGGGNTNTPSSSSEIDWIHTLLTALNAPRTNANDTSIAAWINHESLWNASGPDGALYTHNPLNTTQAAKGATSINSAGVKKYVNEAEGIAATVATIIQYPPILAALRSGHGLCGNPNLGPSFLKWSGGAYSRVC